MGVIISYKLFLLQMLDLCHFCATIIVRIGGGESVKKTRVLDMKKTLFALLAFAGLAACSSYDYYQGNIRYVQDGEDCIFYATESGARYSDDIRDVNTDKEVVYRNTFCRDLYQRDTAGVASRTERQILTSVADVKAEQPKCQNSCCKTVKTKKYVFVK